MRKNATENEVDEEILVKGKVEGRVTWKAHLKLKLYAIFLFLIHWNNIHDNPIFNLFNVDETIEINAENNWWGSDPPNPYGIWGRVDYDPWETAPIDEAGPE